MGGARTAAAYNVRTAVTGGAPAGGWCQVVGKASGSRLTRDDVGKIGLYVNGKLLAATPLNPVLAGAYIVMVGETMKAIGGVLNRYVNEGRTCDAIPNDLMALPEVDAAVPTDPGEIVGNTFSFLMDWTGLGDALMRVAVLVVIVLAVLGAVWRVLR